MKIKKLLLPLVLLLALGSLILLAGCPAPETRPAPPPPNPIPGPGPGGPAPGAPGTENQVQDRQMENGTAGAFNLKTMVEEMPEVNEAWVVVTGKTALVGIDLNANVTGQRVNDVKAKIAERVKAEDNEITEVFVSADADSFTRIRNIARGITNGRPISGFANEINEITKRMSPTNR